MESPQDNQPGIVGKTAGKELAKDLGHGVADTAASLLLFVIIIAVGLGIAAALWMGGAQTPAIIVGLVGVFVASWKTGWTFW